MRPIEETGTQDRFVHGTGTVGGGRPPRARLEGHTLVPDPDGPFAVLWAQRRDRRGRTMSLSYEFATDGKNVFQQDNWTLHPENRNPTWRRRGGISAADLEWMRGLARP